MNIIQEQPEDKKIKDYILKIIRENDRNWADCLESEAKSAEPKLSCVESTLLMLMLPAADLNTIKYRLSIAIIREEAKRIIEKGIDKDLTQNITKKIFETDKKCSEEAREEVDKYKKARKKQQDQQEKRLESAINNNKLIRPEIDIKATTIAGQLTNIFSRCGINNKYSRTQVLHKKIHSNYIKTRPNGPEPKSQVIKLWEKLYNLKKATRKRIGVVILPDPKIEFQCRGLVPQDYYRKSIRKTDFFEIHIHSSIKGSVILLEKKPDGVINCLLPYRYKQNGNLYNLNNDAIANEIFLFPNKESKKIMEPDFFGNYEMIALVFSDEWDTLKEDLKKLEVIRNNNKFVDAPYLELLYLIVSSNPNVETLRTTYEVV